jgi:hypothetical protein
VLGQDEHADVGTVPDGAGAGAFVGERGRHADVNDGEGGAFPFDGGQELVGVAEGGDHLVATVVEEAGEAFAQ